MILLIMLSFVVSMLAAGCGKTESAQIENGSETLQSGFGCEYGAKGGICLHLYGKHGLYSGGGEDGHGTAAG